MIARTPAPPYYAVIFSNTLSDNTEGYAEMAEQMALLASRQPGYLGFESVRDGLGLSISYWKDLDSIRAWKNQADHLQAQHTGRSTWYSAYQVRIARVEHDYAFHNG